MKKKRSNRGDEMCGRFSVISSPLNEMVMEETGIQFDAKSNNDLCPTQSVSTLICVNHTLSQQNTIWGIQPEWANHLIINAKAETAAEKKTFRLAMKTHRCLVPCSGWYEWRDEGGPRKQKYLFTHAEGRPLYMAGIWFPSVIPHLVTLTTDANQQCREYHPRMPVFIPCDCINTWLKGELTDLPHLLRPDKSLAIKIQQC